MGKRFIFTEEQFTKFVQKQLEEDMNVAYQAPSNGVASTTDMKQQLTNAKKNAPGAKINLEVSSDDLGLTESYCLTKKQLQEARIKSLRANSKSVKKKDLF